MTIAQACFFGGLCSHAYIATVGLAGVMMAAGSSCVGAAITSALGKSRRLKKNIFVCIFLGFLIYISVFVWGWNVIEDTKLWRYEVLCAVWLLAYLPFAFYFPYALILFVIPQLDDPDDVIMAAISLWSRFAFLAHECIEHFKKILHHELNKEPHEFWYAIWLIIKHK